MTPTWKVSDEEVWIAIRYLDPDAYQNPRKPEVTNSRKPETPTSRSKYVRRLKTGILVLVLLFIFYLTAVRYLPAAMHFFQ